jgi:sRNA-binding protein
MNPLKAMGLSCNGYSVEELHAAEVAAARWLVTRAKAELENEKAMHAHTQQARAIAFYDKARAEKSAASANHKAKDSMFFGWVMAASAAAVALWVFFYLGGLLR